MSSTPSTTGAVKLAYARFRSNQFVETVALSHQKDLLIYGDTAGDFRFATERLHWDSEVITAQAQEGLQLKQAPALFTPNRHYQSILLTDEATGNPSTAEELQVWLSTLGHQATNLTLIFISPSGLSLACDEEEFEFSFGKNQRATVKIRRDFYRQLEWTWVTPANNDAGRGWAQCRRWYYPQEVDTLLKQISPEEHRQTQITTTDRLERRVLQIR